MYINIKFCEIYIQINFTALHRQIYNQENMVLRFFCIKNTNFTLSNILYNKIATDNPKVVRDIPNKIGNTDCLLTFDIHLIFLRI